MKSKNKSSIQHKEIWGRIEALQRQLEAACMVFDDLYRYVYMLNTQNQQRLEQNIRKQMRQSDVDLPF